MAAASNSPDAGAGTTFERDVFVTHCEDDLEFARELVVGLKRRGFSCGLAKADFVGGVPIFDQIIHAVSTSRKVLAIISNYSLKSYWCTLELNLTLERSNENDILAIVPVLRGVSTQSDNFPDVLKQLECVDGDAAEYLDRVSDMLTAPDVAVTDLLPVGNLGHGLAWSYYCSYLAIILPGLAERIEKLPDSHRRCTPRKIYLLLQESCRCNTLTEEDERIQPETVLETVTRMRAGKTRDYKNSVYKITADKPYYFVGEFCSVVETMAAMVKGEIARMSLEERRRQVYRFKCTLEKIVNRCYSERYRLILYDDTDPTQTERLSDKLLRFIKEDIRADIQLEASEADVSRANGGGAGCDRLPNEEVTMESSNGVVAMDTEYENADLELCSPWKYHAFIMYGEGDKDRELAVQITNFLEGEKGMVVAAKDRDLDGSKAMMDHSYDVMKRSRRTILILSDETGDNGLAIFHMLRTPEKDDLQRSIPPIPVLRCAEDNTVLTDFCKDLTYVDTKEENYKELLFRALTVKVDVPRLPAGNVAEGFAWGYFYSYLKLVLPGLREGLSICDSYGTWQPTISHKLYIFMPENGRMPEELGKIPGIRTAGTVKCEQDRAGNLKRSYSSTVYEVRDSHDPQGQAYYVAGEFITPLAVLQDMEHGPDAGMSSDARARQVTKLYDRLEEILRREVPIAQQLLGKWRLFRYDDSVNISQRLCELIREDMEEDKAPPAM